MGLYINTNIAAKNAQRHIANSQDRLGKNFARLSSGQRITNAGDDAAGLAISQRFTSQIRGLEQAMRNANDAISLAQLAESALNESTSILQRMRELSIQAASDINSESDRIALNDEIEQLKDELTRIGTNTSFNGTKLLDGSFVESFFQVGAFQGETVSVTINDARSKFLARYATKTGNSNVTTNALPANGLVINNVTVRATVPTDDIVSTSFATGSAIAKAAAINAGTSHHGVTARAMATEFVAPGSITGATLDQNDYIVINDHAITGFAVQSDDADNSLVLAINAISDETGVAASLNEKGQLVLRAEDGRNIALEVNGNAGAVLGVGATTVQTASLNLHSPNQYQLSGGSEAEIGMNANEFVGVGTTEVVDTVNVLTRFDANEALLRLDRAINQVVSDRAALGAVSNRMMSTISNLAGIVESSQAARSRIQDADFAAESSDLAKNQILQQAGIAILSQANSSGQQVMSLLQG
ncbi:MAG: flagellin [Myxococcota bacterium]|nr:flagellin [Myxococcota bacterium]